jgi:hypothetical protein
LLVPAFRLFGTSAEGAGPARGVRLPLRFPTFGTATRAAGDSGPDGAARSADAAAPWGFRTHARIAALSCLTVLPVPRVDGPRPLEAWLSRALFAQVGAFIVAHALSASFAALAADAPQRDAIWSALPDRLGPALGRPVDADLRVWLCFLLACHALGLDPAQGARLAGAARHPERWMRLFLSDHGLLDYAAFQARPRACRSAVPVATVATSGVGRFSRRRTTGASAPRRAGAPV